MNKYKHKLPRDELKKHAKELSKKLVESDYKHNRVGNPTKVNEKTERGVKKYAKEFFDKCVARHREHEKKKAAKKASTQPNADGSHTPPGEPGSALKEEDDDEDIKLDDDEDMEGLGDDEDATPSDLKRKRESIEPTSKQDDDSPSSPKKIKSELDLPPPPPPPPPPVPEGMELDDAPLDDAAIEQSAMEDSFVAEAVEAVNGAADNTIAKQEDPVPVKMENGDVNGQPSPMQLATPSTNGSYPYDQEKKLEQMNAERIKQEAATGGGQPFMYDT